LKLTIYFLGETVIHNSSSFPIEFKINYNDEEFKNGIFGRYSLSVRIESQSGDLLFITDTDFSVVDQLNNKLVEHINVHVIKI
jgi:uncharacterized lipoprotein YbaY